MFSKYLLVMLLLLQFQNDSSPLWNKVNTLDNSRSFHLWFLSVYLSSVILPVYHTHCWFPSYCGSAPVPSSALPPLLAPTESAKPRCVQNLLGHFPMMLYSTVV